MSDLFKQIDDWVNKKYSDIRKSGEIMKGIERTVQEIRWEDSNLASLIERKLMLKAIEDENFQEEERKKWQEKKELMQMIDERTKRRIGTKIPWVIAGFLFGGMIMRALGVI